ncbi:hypothetical protein LXA43DRAFT_752607 [Ganoderma leucocontextum]|nr:hypothetical protein LXA43DRAFT_752607 [Ganoderma leucocontextum]
MPRKQASSPPSLVLPSSASSVSTLTASSSTSTSPDSAFSVASSQGTHESIQSAVDSGYASSLGGQHSYLPPHPDYMLSRTYENWKIADAATQRLFVDLRSLEECKGQLRKAKKRQDSNRPKASRKPSLLQLNFRRKAVNITPFPVSPPPSSSFQLDDNLPSVDHLEKQLETLNNRIAATQTASERLDACFEELRKVLDDGRPMSWQSFASSSSSEEDRPPNYASEYTRARKAVAARDQAYGDSKATTKAMEYARTAIQSAHHHYRQSMDLVDVVCGTRKNRWEAILGDEQSRQGTYREAAEWAQKAQICFNECVQALTPHWGLLKRDEIQDSEDLKETGLLQAVQLYKLMYGGKVLQMGITQQVQVMIQKQDAIFARLTNFAVWVQNCTQECAMVELEAREKRDAARRHIVQLWVRADEETESFSLVAPSMGVHVGRSY